MNASKETASEAKDRMGRIVHAIDNRDLHRATVTLADDIKFVSQFLEAARRKLPTEASYAKAKSR